MYTSLKKAGLTFMRSRFTQMLAIASCLLASSQTFGQAADIDQIRNGPADDPQKWFYSTFNNPSYVNGNAGASTAHYVEGMSISYRSLLTGLTVGQQYEYVLEYDTKHSSKHAIDYLTHYQRLEPHGPFSHAAEVINPKIYIKNGKEYQLTVVSTNTFTIPAPATTGTPVAGQPLASYNALPANEKLMTIFNGSISAITYVAQGNLSLAQTSSSIRVRFQADKDSVVLAWGGHIASRLDWGTVGTPPVPRSAGGISGSPYHMRHLSMRTFPGLVNIPLGNQDRSLSAAAVIAPPPCPTVPSQTVCAGTAFQAFTIASPEANTTYEWSFGTNTAGAVFTGGGTTATGNSVTVVKSGGGNFTSGSFTLNITATRNGISTTCNSVASGSVEVVVATASASPTTIDIKSAAHNTTLTADIGAASTDPNNANYTYLWEVVGSSAGSLTNATSRIATYTAGAGDAGQTINFKVTATQIDDPNSPECSDDATTSVSVNVIGICAVTDNAAVCEGTEVTHTGSPNPIEDNTTYKWTLESEAGGGTTLAEIVGPDNEVTVKVNAKEGYTIKLTQTYANTSLDPSVCSQSVPVVATPSISTTYNPPSCSEDEFSVDVNDTKGGFTYSITQPGNPSNTISDITPAQDGDPVHFTGLTAGDGFIVTVNTGGPGCTATSECETFEAVSNNSVVDPATAAKKANDLKKISDNVAETYNITLPSGTKVKSLPNPYTDKVRFNITSGISGLATLEIHNVLGQKVAVVYQGYVQAGRELTKEYYVPSKDRNTLIYTFRVGDQKVSGKLVPVR